MVSATGTSNGSLPFRVADFETLTEGLDYAARGETGVNFYSPRGELVEALSYRDLRERAVSLALRLTAAGYERGTRFAIIADTHSYFHTFFFGLVCKPSVCFSYIQDCSSLNSITNCNFVIWRTK